MDDAGGFLELESRVGKGTSVRLYFPAAEGLPATEALPPEPQPPSQAGSNETILIVEDEYLIRIGTRESLLELGYRVLEAASPAAAVQLVGEGAEAIDLLLSDIVMPGMNGPQLAEKFRTKNPGLRVLFMSAFSALTLEEQGRIAPGVPVLEKPFTDAELAKMVKSSLAHA